MIHFKQHGGITWSINIIKSKIIHFGTVSSLSSNRRTQSVKTSLAKLYIKCILNVVCFLWAWHNNACGITTAANIFFGKYWRKGFPLSQHYYQLSSTYYLLVITDEIGTYILQYSMEMEQDGGKLRAPSVAECCVVTQYSRSLISFPESDQRKALIATDDDVAY